MYRCLSKIIWYPSSYTKHISIRHSTSFHVHLSSSFYNVLHVFDFWVRSYTNVYLSVIYKSGWCIKIILAKNKLFDELLASLSHGNHWTVWGWILLSMREIRGDCHTNIKDILWLYIWHETRPVKGCHREWLMTGQTDDQGSPMNYTLTGIENLVFRKFTCWKVFLSSSCSSPQAWRSSTSWPLSVHSNFCSLDSG